MTAPRENWTDQRLDDLNQKVEDGFAQADKKMDDGFAQADKKMDDGFARADKKMDDGFARVDTDIRELRTGINARFEAVDTRLDKLDAKFDAKFDRLTWGLLASTLGIIATFIGSNAF